jgi:hypothetical protein
MQVYKAWSASFGVCEEPVTAPAPLVTQPVNITLKPKAHRRRRAVAPPPVPSPPRAEVGPPPAATPEAVESWLRHAVALALIGRELGSEGTAALLSGRLDPPMAAGLAQLRDSGQLAAAIDAALQAHGLAARPDVPLERIMRSALRRYDLRAWLPLPARR